MTVYRWEDFLVATRNSRDGGEGIVIKKYPFGMFPFGTYYVARMDGGDLVGQKGIYNSELTGILVVKWINF